MRGTDNSSLTKRTVRNRENIHDRELVNLNDFFPLLKLYSDIYNKFKITTRFIANRVSDT